MKSSIQPVRDGNERSAIAAAVALTRLRQADLFRVGQFMIEVVSGPVRGNRLSATRGCHLLGEGEAWFDELASERDGG